MKPFVLLGSIALLGLGTAGAAAPDVQLMAPIHLFVDSVNKGDMKSAAATFSPASVTIVDDIAPHIWVGTNAFDTWIKALGAVNDSEGNTDPAVALGKPTREIVGSDSGYVVLPAVYTYKAKGIPMRESAQMVFALQKAADGWQITGFSWVGTRPRHAAK